MFYTVSISRVRVRKLEPGQSITGQIGAEHEGISHIECSALSVYQGLGSWNQDRTSLV